MSQSGGAAGVSGDGNKVWVVRFLLFIAGLGGLLYGIDVGIIAGALPYLQATTHYTANELSVIVAAVLLGSVISTPFAGILSDLMGRKLLMALSGVVFVASVPTIATTHSYEQLVWGRLLQGFSAGLIGVAVPLYLAESLPAKSRGKGTGIFQWLLTLGIVAAALIAFCFSIWVDRVQSLGDAKQLFLAKDIAWRGIFWVSLPPGLVFAIGALLVPESPRWLFRRGRTEAALAALRRSRTEEQAAIELQEIVEAAAAEEANVANSGQMGKESLLHRKYVIPFILACVILACTQATGVNSIIGYNATILIQAGLSDIAAHQSYVILTSVNFLATIAAVLLVDRKGRRFLLSLGTAGIILSLVCAGLMFLRTEKLRVDCAQAMQSMVGMGNDKLTLTYNQQLADKLLTGQGTAGKAASGATTNLVVIYSYGGFRAATDAVRSNDQAAKPIEINRDSLPGNQAVALFSNPFASLEKARTAPLVIENALITPVPSPLSGWLIAFFTFCFMASFSVGPGVCVWLALSELMPNRIRSNGMAIALLLNQAVSTTIAAIFLPTVGKYGYSTMFFAFAGFTVIYFITAAFILPETKGKTLEEIEEHFSGGKKLTPATEAAGG